MIKKIFCITFFLLLTFSFNANSADVNFGSAIISSSEIEAGTDPKKKKITVKNAEVKFDDGSIYIGPIKKNKISGKGKLILKDGTVFEGKFKSNKFVNKVNKKNRTYIKLDLKKGINVQNQIKVSGLTKWYPADVVNGEFKLSKKGELMASQDKKALSGAGSSGGSGC
ncbi:hypothetical protein OA070_03240 [Candidatus Pelagibacter sp.]|nr:hypothetical protein [Candidatus Pelagibacter sp.]